MRYLRIFAVACLVMLGLVLISSYASAQYNEKTRQIYIINDSVIKIYDENLKFQSEMTLYSQENIEIKGVSPSHDFSKIAVIKYEFAISTVDIFSLPDLTLISQTEAMGGGFWSSDNVYFIGWQGLDNGNTNVIVVNAMTGQTVHKKELASVSLSGFNPADDTLLLQTGGLGLWKVLGGIEQIKDFGLSGSPSFSPDGQFLAFERSSTKIEIIRLSDYSIINTIEYDYLYVSDIQWTAKGLFVTSYDWNSYLFHPFTDDILWSIPSGFVDEVIWIEDDSRFYKMDLSQGTTVHDGNTGAFIARMMPDLIATFTPDPSWLIPTASDSTYFTPVPTVTAKPR